MIGGDGALAAPTDPVINRLLIYEWCMMAKYYAIAGVMVVVLCVLFLKSSEFVMPRISADVGNLFAVLLLAASTLATLWLFVRYRRSVWKREADDDGRSKAAGPNQDNVDVPETADGYATLRWLVRLGAVTSAVVLAALVAGDPIFVVKMVTLAMVAVAFLLILVLVPRGL